MMCSLKKISLPGNQAAIVPAKYKTGRGSRTTEKSTGHLRKCAREQKQIAAAMEKEMHFRASICIHRHNHAPTAKLERLASIF